MFQHDWIHTIVNLIWISITLILLFLISGHRNTLNQSLPNNQVNICNTLYNNEIELQANGYLPTPILQQLIQGDVENNSDQLERYGRGLNYSLGLSLIDTKDYEVYNLVYYNQDQNESIDVLKVWIDEILEKNEEMCKIKSDLFYIEDNDENDQGDTVTFTKEDYEQTVEWIKSNYSNLKVIYCSVILQNGLSFYDFINQDDLQQLLSDNYFIKSKDTISILNNIYNYQLKRDNYEYYILLLGFVIVLELINHYVVYCKNKHSIRGLMNYGFSVNELKDQFSYHYNDKRKYVVEVMLIILANILFVWYSDKLLLISEYVMSMLFLIVMVFVYMVKNIMTNYMLFGKLLRNKEEKHSES